MRTPYDDSPADDLWEPDMKVDYYEDLRMLTGVCTRCWVPEVECDCPGAETISLEVTDGDCYAWLIDGRDVRSDVLEFVLGKDVFADVKRYLHEAISKARRELIQRNFVEPDKYPGTLDLEYPRNYCSGWM